MNQFRRFMYGRYGFDQFTRALIFVSLFLSVIVTFTRFAPLLIVAYIPLIYAFYRTFSKNIYKRSQENISYFNLSSTVKKKLNQMKLIVVGTKTHKYYRCSSCKQLIRVPRGKGKICITCPKCRKEIVRKT